MINHCVPNIEMGSDQNGTNLRRFATFSNGEIHTSLGMKWSGIPRLVAKKCMLAEGQLHGTHLDWKSCSELYFILYEAYCMTNMDVNTLIYMDILIHLCLQIGCDLGVKN